MASLNKVLLMGNLTRDIEIRYIPSGAGVANTSLAVNRKYRDRQTNELREDVTFVDLEIWGKQVDTAAKYLKKGSPVFIEGRLKLNQWQTESGEKRQRMVVSVMQFQFLPSGKKPDGSAQAPARQTSSRDDSPPEDLEIQEENIPF